MTGSLFVLSCIDQCLSAMMSLPLNLNGPKLEQSRVRRVYRDSSARTTGMCASGYLKHLRAVRQTPPMQADPPVGGLLLWDDQNPVRFELLYHLYYLSNVPHRGKIHANSPGSSRASEEASPAEPKPEGADGSAFYRHGTCGAGGAGPFLRVSRRLPASTHWCRSSAVCTAVLHRPGT
jgi:hypothetical protein